MMLDSDKIAAFWLWFGVVALFVIAGLPEHIAWLVIGAVRRVRRYRLRRRNLGVVRRIQVMQAIESGVDRG